MKKFLPLLVLLIIATSPLFAANTSTDTLIINSTIEETNISTTLYYGSSTNLVLEDFNLASGETEITNPFYLKVIGNIASDTTIYMGISSEYFHNPIVTSKIKPEVYFLQTTEVAGYKTIGEYKSSSNDPTISAQSEYHSIVEDLTNTNKGTSLKLNLPQMDTLFGITLPHAKHMNDTVLVFALTWDTQKDLSAGAYTSNITVTYYSDL
jgi:hypothetical protein